MYLIDNGELPRNPDVLFQTSKQGRIYLDPDHKQHTLVDSRGTPLRFTKQANHSFDLRSAGPDRIFETDDDDIIE
jgi:hypothetical protein